MASRTVTITNNTAAAAAATVSIVHANKDGQLAAAKPTDNGISQEQIKDLVRGAFDIAACDLHDVTGDGAFTNTNHKQKTQDICTDPFIDEDGIFSLPAAVIAPGQVPKPQRPKTVERNKPGTPTSDGAECAPKLEEQQVACYGTCMYLPGVGCIYQEDSCELGETPRQ